MPQTPPEQILSLAEQLPPTDQRWLWTQLGRLVQQQINQTEPESARPLSSAEVEAQFSVDVAAFERLKPSLLQTHYGQVVAIYQEQVAAVGPTRTAVLRMMRERFGNVPCYVERVEEVTPRRVRIPSMWRVAKP